MKSKQLYLTLLLIVISIASERAKAQFVITYDQLIHPGDSVTYTKLDTTNFYVGNAGANVLWDYSNINILQLNYQTTYFQAGAPTVCPSYPANIVFGYSTSWPAPPEYRYSHYLSDSTQFSYLGRCELMPFAGSRYLRYTDPMAFDVAPLTYLDSIVDTILGIDAFGINLEDTTIIEGYSEFYYDAFGELRLPWGIYSNVARVRMITFRKDTAITSPNGPGDVNIYFSTSYLWYDINSRGLILYYGEGTTTSIPVNGPSTISTYKSATAQTNISTGIQSSFSSKETLKIHPNPSNGKFLLQCSDFKNGMSPIKITICNMLGRTICQKIVLDNFDLHEFDLSTAAKGMYIVTLTSKKCSYSN